MSHILDSHGQPLHQGFNRKRNIEKAASGLMGILRGLTADARITEQEALFLDVWLRNQTFLQDDGDLVDIIDLVSDILKDNVVTRSELEDLQALLSDIVAFRDDGYINSEAKVNELIGLISGVAADGCLSDSEIECIVKWLDDHSQFLEEWPVSVVKRRIMQVLEDGVITESERVDMLDTIRQITGYTFEETSIAEGKSTEFLEDPISSLVFEDMRFCFTGKFVSGGRATQELSVQLRGGIPVKKITSEVNYLIIGALASRDWRFSSHGRKIEEALRLRQSGVVINVLTERTWLNFLG
jgi:hypothetical protein